MNLAIVGGGIAGLAAAVKSYQSGVEAITLFEGSDRLGGKIRTSWFLGHLIEEGPDAFLTREPYALDLATLVAPDNDFVSPSASAALIGRSHRLYRLPKGLVLGAPTSAHQIIQADLLTLTERANALAHFFLRPHAELSTDNLGLATRRRYGRAIEDYLVDPLVGGINASSIDHTSMEIVAPAIAKILQSRHQSSLSQPTQPARPPFLSVRDGLESLVAACTGLLIDRGVTVKISTPVKALEIQNRGWVIRTSAGDQHFDAVILAAPPAQSSDLLRNLAAPAAELLRGIPTSSVAIITVGLARPPVRIESDTSGILSPAPEKRFITAVSFAHNKWPHWCDPGTGLLRISVGRRFDLRHTQLSDDALVARVIDEASGLLNEKLDPTETRVTRWPSSFPQFLPHHRKRIELLQETVTSLPPLAFAGAYVGGSGIPTCIKSAHRAVDRIIRTTSDT
ncbi:MAG: protoporphyrinogen oxidase [Acidimicrobiales bacterium]